MTTATKVQRNIEGAWMSMASSENGEKWLRVRGRSLRMRGSPWPMHSSCTKIQVTSALLIALRQGEHVLVVIGQDDDLWARVEDLLAQGVADADQLLEGIDQLLTDELEILVRAGIPTGRAEQLLSGTSASIRRYLDRVENGDGIDVGRLREGMYELSREVSSARAELERVVRDRPEAPPVPRERRRTRYFRLALRTLHVAGGVTEIVIDVGAAHATFGATLLSVLHGVSEVGDALAETG